MRLAVIDSEEIERTAVKWMLKHSPLTARVVFETSDLRHFEEGPPPALDVVLVDPEHASNGSRAAGSELVSRLSRQVDPVPIVVMSYSKSGAYVLQAMRSGAADYLFKPVAKHELVDCLGRVAGIGRLRSGKTPDGAPDGTPARAHREGTGQTGHDLRSHAQNEFLYDLLFGNIDSQKEVWRRTRLVGLDPLPNVVMVVSIDDFVLLGTDRSESWKRALRRDVLDQVRSCLTGVNPPPSVLAVAEDRGAVLIHIGNEAALESKSYLLGLADKIRLSVASALTVTVSVGVGNPQADATRLHVSFTEAHRALGYKFFLGENLVVHADEVSLPGTRVHFLSGGERVPSLIARVRVKDKEGAIRALNRILDDMFAASRSAEAVKLAATEVILTVVRIAFETGAYADDILNLSAEWVQEAIKASGASELRQIMTRAIEHVVDTLNVAAASRHVTLLRRAVNHINDNFAHELTLKEVARTVWLSPAYLSHLFSRELGWSFVEYVTKVRIERAQMLLVGTSLSISEVAAEVGYRDASYFSRVFKTATGQSPTQYRMQALKA